MQDVDSVFSVNSVTSRYSREILECVDLSFEK